jgi:SAM-dependent methyltransferase
MRTWRRKFAQKALSFPDNKLTHSFTNFAIMAMPEPDKVAAHIYRTLKPGGTAVITTWKHIGYVHGGLFTRFRRPQKHQYQNPILLFLPNGLQTPSFVMSLVGAGFQPATNIEIKTHSEIISTAIWGMERAGKRTRSINGHDALKKQIETEEASPSDVEMVAWLAVVRK